MTKFMAKNLGEIESCLNWWLQPGINAEGWDNVGLLVGSGKVSKGEKIVKTILLCNDLTLDVVSEAIREKTDLIIAYHPPLFRPLKTITNGKWKEDIMLKCIANDIAIYSPHTALDSVPGGINDSFVACLNGVGDIKRLLPVHNFSGEDARTYVSASASGTVQQIASMCEDLRAKQATGITHGIFIEEIMKNKQDVVSICAYMNAADDRLKRGTFVYPGTNTGTDIAWIGPMMPIMKNTGSGRIVEFTKRVQLSTIVDSLKAELKLDYIQVARAGREWVSSVGICAGSGSSLLANTETDLVITGEMSHHEMLDFVVTGKSVILCGHCNSERHFLPKLEVLLKIVLGGRENACPKILISGADKSPLEVV